MRKDLIEQNKGFELRNHWTTHLNSTIVVHY